MQNPKISIIVPIYNAEKTLNRCVDSILQQTFTDFELLLINDGSKDRSGCICDEYAAKDSRISVFHKENGGVSSARNLGLDNSNGEWVTFCDSDDYVDSDWLWIFISSLNGVETDLVCQGLNRMGYYAPLDYCTGISFIGNNKGALYILWKSSLLGYTVNKTFRKSILDNNKLYFDEKLTFKEDEEFVLRYLKYCKQIVCIPNTGYNYDMPDLSNKYKYVDNYYTSLSSFQSVKSIYRGEFNKVYQEYINQLTNALFASYSFTPNDVKYRLKMYRLVVGNDIFKVKELSNFSKIVSLLPLKIANFIFLLKNRIKNLF